MVHTKCWVKIGMVLLLSLSGVAWAAETDATALKDDPQTLLLLEPQGSGVRDITGRFTSSVKGATVVADPRFGRVLAFGDGDHNGISIADGGKMNFEKGFTLETWVYLQGNDKTPNEGGMLARKLGTLEATITKGLKFSARISFPTMSIFTTDKKQYDYFPVGGVRFTGISNLPQNQWVRLAITYNPDRKVVRSWIDGGIDRTAYLARPGTQLLPSNPSRALTLFTDMKNIRVGPTRISTVARHIGWEPPMEIYVHELPYTGKVAMQIEHLDPMIQYPVDLEAVLEIPTGASQTVHRVQLKDATSRVVEFSTPSWRNSMGFTLHIKAFSQNRQIYKVDRLTQNLMARKGSRLWIGPDKLLTIDGKKIFPVMLYHVPPADFQAAADLGFNIVTPFNILKARMSQANIDRANQALAAAKAANVYLAMAHRARATEHLEQIGLRYIADEPWVTFDKIRLRYALVKASDAAMPGIVVQNNQTRFSESAEAADILGCDPYPIPSVSLRDIAYTTANAVRAVAGIKPVWTVLPQYGPSKLPSLQELRCMIHLAVISGANGLGIYSWDERYKPTDTKAWYMKNSPKDLNILRQAMAEVRKLNGVLIIPNSGRKTTFSPETPALHAAVKERGGKIYLLVANDARREHAAALKIDGIGNATGVSLEGDPSITLTNGMFQLHLPAHGVGVYELRTLVASQMGQSSTGT